MNNFYSFPLWLVCFIGFIFVSFASLAEAFEYRERFIETSPSIRLYFSQYWHWFQLFERFLAILFGFSLAFSNAPITIFFFIASLFWIVYDASINFSRNKNMWYVSDAPVSPFDLFAHKYLKLFFFIVTLFLVATSS